MTKNLPANMNDLIGALDHASAAIAVATGGDFQFIKMLKTGDWVYGAEDTEVAEDSDWVIDTGSFVVGYQAWDEDGDLQGEVKTLVTEPPVPRGDLENVGAPWKPLIGCNMVCIKGGDKGVQVHYATTSKGGIKAVNSAMKAVVNNAKSGKHEGKFTPVVSLESDHYKHKQYGRIYTPELNIIDWVADYEAPAAVEPVDEDDVDLAVDEPKAVAQAPEEKPARRRRRA